MNYKISGFADEIDVSFDTQLRVLNELSQNYLELRGADGIGVADFTMEKAAELNEKLKKSGIGVSAIGSPIGKIGITDDFGPHFETFKHVVELAKFFETDYIRMFSFYLPDENNIEIYRDEVLDRLAQMISYARKAGVILLHENEKGIYGATADGCKDLFTHLYGDYFKGIFDFANFVQCKQDTINAYEKLKAYITYFHVKDAIASSGEVVLPGTGDGNLKIILKRAIEDGFTGFYSLEPHLFHFKGFDGLEKEGDGKAEGNNVLAYKAASKSFIKIMDDIVE